MAGTHGLLKFKGYQLGDGIMRNRHFDVNNPIDEQFININWHNHREILEDTKIDVWVQANNVEVAGLSILDVTDIISDKPESTGINVEGVVTSEKVQIRQTGTEDFPYIDNDGDRVYGKLRFDSSNNKWFLDFYSMQPDGMGGEVETPYTFAVDAPNMDFRYVLRTNLSVIPVNALIQGGAGFVEGATDAKAYMNILQLAKDIYGAAYSLDHDGNANLATSIVDQIDQEITNRQNADQEIRDDLASTLVGKGASLVGVVTDPNYTGNNVQEVLSNLAQRIKNAENGGLTEVADTHTRDADSANGYFAGTTFNNLEERLLDIETVVDTNLQDHEDRLTKLETEDEEEVFIATGGETEYNLVNGVAKPKTVLLFIDGAVQAPGVNYDYKTDDNGFIIGFNFAPDTLTNGAIVYVKYKKKL